MEDFSAAPVSEAAISYVETGAANMAAVFGPLGQALTGFSRKPIGRAKRCQKPRCGNDPFGTLPSKASVEPTLSFRRGSTRPFSTSELADFLGQDGFDDPPCLHTFQWDFQGLDVASRLDKSVSIVALRQRRDGLGWCRPSARADGFTILIDALGCGAHDARCDDRTIRLPARRCGGFAIFDRRLSWKFDVKGPLECLMFHVTRHAMASIGGTVQFRWSASVPGLLSSDVVDETMEHLCKAARAALSRAVPGETRCINHLGAAAVAHAAARFGVAGSVTTMTKGGLAPWQQRRVKEVVLSDLTTAFSLAGLADACGLSQSHFTRAFGRSFQCSPHHWLINERLNRVKSFLEETGLPLSDVALASGFADQSHMTRLFSRREGISPAAWRRNLPRSKGQER